MSGPHMAPWQRRLIEARRPDDNGNNTPLNEAVRIIEAIPGGREWEGLLIEPGLSKNGRYYPADVLRESAPLFEGAYSYARHRSPGEGERHPNDKIGRFSQVRTTDAGLVARFKVVAPWVRDLLREAMESGEPDFVGFSIDATGRVARREHEGRPVAWVEAIGAVNSVDLVSEPAAGGRVVRLVASAETATENEDSDMSDELKAMIEALSAKIDAVATKAAPTEAPAPTLAPTGTDGPAVVTVTPRLTESEARALLKGRISEAMEGVTLSEAGRTFVRDGLLLLARKGEVSDEDIAESIRRQQDYEAARTPVAAASIGTDRVTVGDGPRDKVRKALTAWFANETPPDGIKPLRSLQEGYCRWNGIDYFDLNPLRFAKSFQVQYDGQLSHEEIQESLATATWGQIFADVLYLRLIKEFGRMQEIEDWRLICSDIVSVGDFRTYHYARVGGYADLTSVAEGATYPTLTTPGDEETTFSVAKYGGIEDWTMEAALNDVANKVRQLPSKMAEAASRTLYKYVMNLATTTNPTLGYDSVALYDSGHSNTGTTALSVAGLDTTQIAMRDQVPYGTSAEVMGPRAKIKYIITPNELEARAKRIVDPSPAILAAIATSTDSNTEMDPQRWKGSGIVPITYDYLTDANDWWAVADPSRVPTIVMGFLNGMQSPELFLQQDPTVGSNFTADKTAAKCRIIYGGAVLDHRAFYRQVVT